MTTEINLTQLYDLAAHVAHTLPPACERRLVKAVALVEVGAVERIVNGYAVVSQSNAETAYYVSDACGCDCPDAQRAPIVAGRVACKHQIAVWLYRKLIAPASPAPAWQTVTDHNGADHQRLAAELTAHKRTRLL